MFHYSFSVSFVGTTGNYQLGFASFFFSLFHRICLVEFLYYQRNPPTEEELKKKIKKLGLFTFTDIFSAIKDMPKVMWQLALVYLFQWYALFCYWQNSSKVLRCLFGIQPQKI
jgi:maltose/moltooligosaccharide transporter